VWLQEVTGELGGSPLRIESAQVALQAGRVDSVAVRGRIRDLSVDALARAKLPDVMAGIVDETGLSSGLADLDFDFATRVDGEPTFEVAVNLRQGRAQPRKAPLLLEDVQLTARFRSEGEVEIERARAALNGGQVEATGILRRSAEGKIVPDVELRLTAMPVTDATLRDLPEAVQQIRELLGLQDCQLDGKVSLRPAGMALDVRVSGAEICPQPFPYSLENVSCNLQWSSDAGKVVVQDFVGQHGRGAFRGSGTVNLVERATVDLVLEGRDLPLDEQIHSLLPANAHERWGEWAPIGHFDFSLQMRNRELTLRPERDSPLAGIDAEVRLRDVSLTNASLGLAVRRLRGQILANENMVEITRVAGDALGVEFEAKGYIPLGPMRTGGRVLIACPRRWLTRQLVEGWPEEIAREILKFSPEGEFELQAELQDVGNREQGLAANLTLALHDLALHIGEVPVLVTGTASASVEHAGTKDIALRCVVLLDRVRASRFYGSDLLANLSYSEGRITLAGCDMTTFGGRLSVGEGFCELPELNWQLKGQISHLDLESLMAAFGVEGKKAPAGSLRGMVELSGRGTDRSTMNGRGELQIDRGRLYNLPIIVAVLNLFDLRLTGQSPVSYAYAAFRVDKETVHLEDVLLAGGAFPLHILGTVGIQEDLSLNDQPVDLIFSIPRRRGILDEIPIINWVKHLTIDQFRSRALQSHIAGTIGNYQAKSVLQPVMAPISSMWKLLQKLSPEQAEEYLIP